MWDEIISNDLLFPSLYIRIFFRKISLKLH